MTATDPGPALPRNRRLLFASISLGLGLVLALGVAEWALGIYFQRLQFQSMDPGLIRYHAQLGWSLSPNWTGTHTHHDYTATYRTTAGAFQQQTPPAAGATPRIAVLGDSFTFGLGVEDDETFASLLNAQGVAAFENYGVPGTSTDQHLLLLRSLLGRTPPEVAVMVVYLPNDLLDNTLEYPLQADQAKPFFTLEGSRLTLRNTPVPQAPKPARLRETTLGTLVLEGFESPTPPLGGTQLGRLWQTVTAGGGESAETLAPVFDRTLATPLRLFLALMDDARTATRAAGTELRVVLLPGRDAMVNADGLSHHFQAYLRQAIVAGLAPRGVPVLDLMAQLESDPAADPRQLYFPNDGHLTLTGHRYVADALMRELTP